MGNLPANETETIILEYLQVLEVSQNKFWKYHLLGTLTPRFPNGSKDLQLPEPIYIDPWWHHAKPEELKKRQEAHEKKIMDLQAV